MSLAWCCISGCLLRIFQTEVQLLQDGCGVLGLGNVPSSYGLPLSPPPRGWFPPLPPSGEVDRTLLPGQWLSNEMIHWLGSNQALLFPRSVCRGLAGTFKQFPAREGSVTEGVLHQARPCLGEWDWESGVARLKGKLTKGTCSQTALGLPCV